MVYSLFQYVSSFLSQGNEEEITPISAEGADTLSDHRPRIVLSILSNSDKVELDVGELSTSLAKWEYGRNYSSKERQNIYRSLNGSHLPKLDNTGFIEYDRDGRLEVRPKNDSIEEIEEYLERYPSEDSLFPNARETHLDMDEEDLLTMNEGFRMLGNERRRFVLNYMDDHDKEEFDFKELYQNLAASETGMPVEELSPSDWRKHNVNLRQVHLPTLDELKIVDFDEENNDVRRDAYFEPIVQYLPNEL